MTADAVGGVWSYAIDLARELAGRDIATTLAVLGPLPSRSQRAAAERVPGLRLRSHPGRLEWMQDPWDDVDDAGEWLLRLEREERPDVVHVNGYAHAALPWSARAICVAHSCVLTWWRAVHGMAAPAEWREYRRRVRGGLDATDVVVAPTRAMLAALAAEHGPLRCSIVIHNGCAVPAAPRQEEPFVLSAGRLWDEAKNMIALTRVARALPWPVVLAGDAQPPQGEPRAFDNVVLCGVVAQEELFRLMRRAAVYAHPARYEPFGLSVLEAAASGCAPVLADIPSLRELWDGAATFAPPDDDAALCSALATLAGDDRRRRALGARAAERARRYSLSRCADAYFSLYESSGATLAPSLASVPALASGDR